MLGLGIWFLLGLVCLAVGAELLVSGASRLAARAGVSPLVVGLTVVAFGTSAPELTVSVQAAWQGASDLALGNVVGSNIFNVLLILGASALAAPLVVTAPVVQREVPIMIAVSVALVVAAVDGSVGRLDGAAFLVGLLAYIAISIRAGRREHADVQAEYAEAMPESGNALASVAVTLSGLVLLVIGTRWVVDGATGFARAFGVSELVIGLTLVAGGTSLPELATSFLATRRGQPDIAVGNVVGSNIFNILAILGVAAIISPLSVSTAALWFDIPVMVAVALACLPLFLSHHRITRVEGACLLTAYLAYTGYVVVEAAQHEFLPFYRTALTNVVLPLTVIALIELTRRTLRR